MAVHFRDYCRSRHYRHDRLHCPPDLFLLDFLRPGYVHQVGLLVVGSDKRRPSELCHTPGANIRQRQ